MPARSSLRGQRTKPLFDKSACVASLLGRPARPGSCKLLVARRCRMFLVPKRGPGSFPLCSPQFLCFLSTSSAIINFIYIIKSLQSVRACCARISPAGVSAISVSTSPRSNIVCPSHRSDQNPALFKFSFLRIFVITNLPKITNFPPLLCLPQSSLLCHNRCMSSNRARATVLASQVTSSMFRG